MPTVLVDASVALPALLSPESMQRKFWVLLTLGALHQQVANRRLELAAWVAEGSDVATACGVVHAQRRLADAEDRRAVLAEQVPHGTPDDWVAFGSAPLFAEYELKLRERGLRINPALGADEARRLTRQAQQICVAAAAPCAESETPSLTGDPTHDRIVFSGLVAGVDLMVSDERTVVPNNEFQLYRHGGHELLAITFQNLVAHRAVAWPKGRPRTRWEPRRYPCN